MKMNSLDIENSEDLKYEIEYAEYYDDENYSFQYEDSMDYVEEENMVNPLTFTELYDYCILATFGDSYKHLLGILSWSLLFLISSRIFRLPKSLVHFMSCGFGYAVIWQMFAVRSIWIVNLFVISYFFLLVANYLLKKWRGPTTFIAGISYLVACEIYYVDPLWWHALRGIQMIILMKMVSIGYDTDKGSLKTLPSPLALTGYVFTPGTVIFGPWIPFSTYNMVTTEFNLNFSGVFKMLWKLLLSVFFLICSTCLMNWIIPEESNKWMLAYRDALSFRTSHYFVSFLSEVSCELSGLGGIAVSRPTFIELPRSLVEVVVYWNVPMHRWLKNYVFEPSNKIFGKFFAVVLTYATSTLIHGMNFQLGAVLLSLSFYTYTEHTLRAKLALFLDSCVLSRPCKNSCEHSHKGNSSKAMFTNSVFGLLAMFHLAYLGMMFDSSRGIQEKGYSMVHTIRKWNDLGFVSHWVMMSMYSLMSVL